MEIEKAAGVARRGAYVRRSPELKAAIVAECLAPGASVAAVALSHGVNANLVRKWIEKSRPSTKAETDLGWLAVVPDTPPPATRAAVIQADTPQIDTPLERIIAERSSTFMRRESRKAKNHTTATTRQACARPKTPDFITSRLTTSPLVSRTSALVWVSTTQSPSSR